MNLSTTNLCKDEHIQRWVANTDNDWNTINDTSKQAQQQLLTKLTKKYIQTTAKIFFIEGPNLHDNHIDTIKRNTRSAFGSQNFGGGSSGYDNAFVCIDNIIVSCAVIQISNKFIFNLCTHQDFQKKGFATLLMKGIINKYRNINRHQLITLDTDTNESGNIAKNFYMSLNWINEKNIHINTRNKMLFFPQTGICNKENKLIKHKIITQGNFLKQLETNSVRIVSSIINYIINNDVDLNIPYSSDNIMSVGDGSIYQNLLLYELSKYTSPLYNHVTFLENNIHCKGTINNLNDNYKHYPYFLIVFIYKNQFFIINKVHNKKEYIVSKRLLIFELLKDYFNLS